MERTTNLVACQEFLDKGQQPTVMYRRERDRPKDAGMYTGSQVGFGDVWYVNARSISQEIEKNIFAPGGSEQGQVDKVKHEEFVRIPLFRYRAAGRNLQSLFGFAAQIGATARHALPADVRQVLQMHLAIGDVFDRKEQDCLEFYLGIAFRCNAD